MTTVIAGGGPAGMVLGYVLARAGVDVLVLEKHADFLRDFRGDTVHPSTLAILRQLGLLRAFNGLAQTRARQLSVHIGARVQPVIDFGGLKPFDYLALVPQWDLLNLLAEEGRRLSGFDLRMEHDVLGPTMRSGRVAGVRCATPQGERSFDADLVVACDGRHSSLRRAVGLQAEDFGAPMDVLWFRLPRAADAPGEVFAIVGAGKMMVLLDRADGHGRYWQAAYVVPKGGDTAMRERPIAALQRAVASLAPFLAAPSATLQSWQQVKTLQVQVDRLSRWFVPGLLCIGDAAHAMSPVGGVGINLAIQDAVAAANMLAAPLAAGTPIDDALLLRIQRRRSLPVRLTQAVQLQIQQRVIARVLAGADQTLQWPPLLRWALQFRVVRNLPARFIGYGVRRERVHTSLLGDEAFRPSPTAPRRAAPNNGE